MLALTSFLVSLLLYLQAVRTESIKFLQGRYFIKESISVCHNESTCSKRAMLIIMQRS